MDGNPSCDYNGGGEFGGGADNPVVCADWSQAKAFCKGIEGRLPTEAEWEYAARGGTKTRYYCGERWACLGDIAWYDENSSTKKHSVKQKDPNAYGLYDMLGNVLEWTNDWYVYNYYDSSPTNNPQGPDSGSSRVVRGGCFVSGDFGLRVSYRGGPSTGINNLGFRCAKSIEP
jgi:formylglycine-generating enzyme required for sulfatase activity